MNNGKTNITLWPGCLRVFFCSEAVIVSTELRQRDDRGSAPHNCSFAMEKNPLASWVITVLHNLKIYKTLATCTYDCLLIAVMDQDLYTTEAPFLMVSKPATLSSCPGSSPGQGHCVVFLDTSLSQQERIQGR